MSKMTTHIVKQFYIFSQFYISLLLDPKQKIHFLKSAGVTKNEHPNKKQTRLKPKFSVW